MGSVGPAAPPAEAGTTQIGNDISWPQCAPPSGYGNPMPADRTGFVVLGLTRGLPFVENPCLAEQARWVRYRSRPFQAYTMAAYPTAEQLARYRTGPLHEGDANDGLRNVGWAQARYAVASLQRFGLKPARVWIDVEKRNRQPWPTGVAKQPGNVAVLQGLVAGLKNAGFETGFYANASDWAAITGNWRSPEQPFWGTVGTRGQATAAAACARPGPNGGPVHLVQWWTTSPAVDWDLTCPGYSVPSPPVSLSRPLSSASWSSTAAPMVTVSAGPSRRLNWALSARDACTGRVAHTAGGTTSDLISATWRGETNDAGGRAASAPAGVYRLQLRTGVTSALAGESFSALHELVTYGSTRVGGCRATRIAGPDVYATAVQTGAVNFPTATTVVLASGEAGHLVDAVTAAPYARALAAPLLLTAGATLPAVVAADLTRRKARSVVVIGGPSAVSAGVVSALQRLGLSVTRVAGADRYATAALLAARVGTERREILVASGADDQLGYALVAGGVAAGLGIPVLLTESASVPAATADALRRLGAATATVTVVGPTSSVSTSVQTGLGEGAQAVRRVAGADLARTATALLGTYLPGLGGGPVSVASAAAPADLLTAGSLGRPVLVTGTTAMPAATSGWVSTHPGTAVRVIGSPRSVAPGVVVAIGR